MYQALVSVDLGRVNDYTAVIVAEEAVWVGERPALEGWMISGPQVDAWAMWPGEDLTWMPPSSLAAGQRAYFRARTYSPVRPSRPPLLVRHIERVRERSYVD